MRTLLLSIPLFFIISITIAQTTEHRLWNKKPIHIELPTNQEQLIIFPEPFELGTSSHQLLEKLRILNANNTLYIKALEEFPKNRVLIKLTESNEIIPLDLSSHSKAKKTPIKIIYPQPINDEKPITPTSPILSDITLMRYVIQTLYAPERLLPQNKAIQHVELNVPDTIPLYRGNDISVRPLAGYTYQGKYITAFLLKNNTSVSVSLSPHAIRGHWKSVAFYPLSKLKPAGDHKDRTTVFLIADQPLKQVLGGYLA